MRTLRIYNRFATCGLLRESGCRTAVNCAINCAATVGACCYCCAVRVAECAVAPVAAVYGCAIHVPGFQTAGVVAARFIARVRQPQRGRLRNKLRRYGWCVLLLLCRPGGRVCSRAGCSGLWLRHSCARFPDRRCRSGAIYRASPPAAPR